MARTALLVLLPLIAAVALSRRRRLAAIIGMGLFSLVLSAVYLFSHAPDVAITEAAIGAALVTFIYVLAIRKTGRLVVLCDEVPGLLQREGESLVGLEHEILSGFAHHLGLDLVVRFLPRQKIEGALLQGEGDIGAGGIVEPRDDERLLSTPEHLATALFHVSRTDAEGSLSFRRREEERGGYFSDVVEAVRAGKEVAYTLDLARFVALSRLNLSDYTVTRLAGPHSYVFLLAADREMLHRQLVSYLDRLRTGEELARMIQRYFP